MQQPVEIALVAPRLVEQLEQHQLAEAAGVLRRRLGVAHAALDDLRRRRDPAGAGAGRDDLGEGIHAHHPPVHVHAQI